MAFRAAVKCESGTSLPKNGPCPECGAGPGERCPKAAIRDREELLALRAAMAEVPEWFVSQFMEHRHFTAAHMMDVIGRKDAKEYRLEGDWLKQFIPLVKSAKLKTAEPSR